MTVRDLLRKSMLLIGAVSVGEDLSADEASDGLSSLNDLLDSWSTDGLLLTSQYREVFNLVGGQQSYTMGVGGNFNSSSPLEVLAAAVIPAGSNPKYELPLDILTTQEWQNVKTKALSSTLPTSLYLENRSPLANIFLYPVPSSVNELVLYSTKPIANFATVNDTIQMNPGYTRALRYNLAMELAVEYGKDPSAIVVQTATDLKAKLMRGNMEPVYMESDALFLGRRKGFNWLTGE